MALMKTKGILAKESVGSYVSPLSSNHGFRDFTFFTKILNNISQYSSKVDKW